MPEVYVHAVKGRSLDQKRALIKDITEAVVKNFSVPADVVMVDVVTGQINSWTASRIATRRSGPVAWVWSRFDTW